MKNTNRTDLALEVTANIAHDSKHGVEVTEALLKGLDLTHIEINEAAAKEIGKPAGDYLTLHCPDGVESAETEALTSILSAVIPDDGRILVAGLGNENITPDSLGSRTVSRVAATAHFSEQPEFSDLGMREVFVVETGVLAQTGIESSHQLKLLADGLKPDMIVAVDSLACSEMDRLGTTIQITNTGIAPGSGVKNIRHEVSEKVFGVPVIAIGVPTVVDLSSVSDDENIDRYNAMVVPKNIDSTVNHFAKVISKSLNAALNPTLTTDELDQLLF